MSDNEPDGGQTGPDPASSFLLGGFMTAIAFPLLVWTAFSSTTRVMLINGIGGVILLAAGIGFLIRGRIIRKRSE